MKHSQYTSFFRQVAESHPVLAHDFDNHCTFARVILSGFPSIELEIMEFLSMLPAKFKYPCMLSESYQAQFSDNNADQINRNINGAFLILDKYTSVDNFDSIETSIDTCQKISDDVISFMKRYFIPKQRFGYLMLPEVSTEAVQLPESTLAGIRTNFTLRYVANSNIKFDETIWSILPENVNLD